MLTKTRSDKLKTNAVVLGLGVTGLAALIVAGAPKAQATMTASSAGVTYYTSTATVPSGLGYAMLATEPPSSDGSTTPDGTNSTYTGTYSSGAFQPVPWASVSLNGQNGYASQYYPDIVLGSGTYHVGEYFDNFGDQGNWATLLTVTLGAGTPSNFQFGVFDAPGDGGKNAGGAVGLLDGSQAMNSSGGLTPGSVTVLASETDNSTSSDLYGYYLFNITGAASGDSFTYADQIGPPVPSGGYISVATAGVAFGAVPEPASFALVGAGALGLLLATRRRTMA